MLTTCHPVDFAYTAAELTALFAYARTHDVEQGGRDDARSAAWSWRPRGMSSMAMCPNEIQGHVDHKPRRENLVGNGKRCPLWP